MDHNWLTIYLFIYLFIYLADMCWSCPCTKVTLFLARPQKLPLSCLFAAAALFFSFNEVCRSFIIFLCFALLLLLCTSLHSWSLSWRRSVCLCVCVCVCVFFSLFSQSQKEKIRPPCPPKLPLPLLLISWLCRFVLLAPQLMWDLCTGSWGAWNLPEFFFLSVEKRSQSVEVFALEKQTQRDEDRDRDLRERERERERERIWVWVWARYWKETEEEEQSASWRRMRCMSF